MRKGVFNSVLDGHFAKSIPTPQFQYEATIFIRGTAFKTIAVKSFARTADYDKDMFESIRLLVAVPPSTRNIAVLKGYDDLEVTLVTRVNNRLLSTRTYHAYAQGVSSAEQAAITKDLANSEMPDLKSISWLVLELYDRVAWRLRRRQIGGMFGPTTPLDVARYILSKTELRDDLGDKDFVYSINYQEEDQKMYEVIDIPEDTNYLDVFDFLQNHYGIYSRGMGIFLAQQNWSLFKPYNPDRFAEGGKRLVIYNVYSDEVQAPDRNFYIEGDVTYIAATGDSKVNSEIDSVSLNEGSGVRFADVRSLEHKMYDEVGDNKELNPEKYLSEVNTNPRGGGTFAPMHKDRYTDNPKKLSSDLYRRRGVVITVMWENGLYGQLEPGMGVEFYYPDAHGVKKMRGTLLGTMEHSSILGGGVVEATHGNQIALTLLLFPYG